MKSRGTGLGPEREPQLGPTHNVISHQTLWPLHRPRSLRLSRSRTPAGRFPDAPGDWKISLTPDRSAAAYFAGMLFITIYPRQSPVGNPVIIEVWDNIQPLLEYLAKKYLKFPSQPIWASWSVG
jgi:hypothetical protein